MSNRISENLDIIAISMAYIFKVHIRQFDKFVELTKLKTNRD